MKANELMIDDWVLHEGEPYQIRQLGIYGVDRDGEDYPAVCVGKPKGVGLIAERNEIEPIPLTAEILEKNGFSDKYAEDDLSYATDYCGDVIGVHICGKGGIMDEMYFNYVHELQHALKLCRIDKTIEL